MKIRKYFHQKLVRDKVLELIKARKGAFQSKIVSKSKAKILLRKKLIEEAKEIVGAKKDSLLGELADVLQILKSIGENEGMTLSSIISKAEAKEKIAGAYKKRIYLVWSDKPQGFGDKSKEK